VLENNFGSVGTVVSMGRVKIKTSINVSHCTAQIKRDSDNDNQKKNNMILCA